MISQSPPLNVAELAKRLHESVRHRLDPKAHFSAWTKQLFRSLEEIAKPFNYEVYRSGSEGFLLDLIWYEQSTHAIVLAAEIEWAREETKHEPVSYDFEKLMQVKAPLKLMVFQTSSHHRETDAVIGNFSRLLNSFRSHLEGEEYLLVEFTKPWNRAYCYQLRASTSGKIDHPKFLPITEFEFTLDWQG